jgi:hypothetical protein
MPLSTRAGPVSDILEDLLNTLKDCTIEPIISLSDVNILLHYHELPI